MRAISLVNRIEFEFTGNVARNAIALGDLDNDGCNELVIGNDNGKVAVFKGRKKFQVISKLSFVSCIAIGDILNEKRNHLVVVTADGWCYIYKAVLRKRVQENEENPVESVDTVDGQVFSGGSTDGIKDDSSSSSKRDAKEAEDEDELQLLCLHVQRIPANAKDILLADVNADGFIEMVLGLTDRVVRSYRWVPNIEYSSKSLRSSNSSSEETDVRTDKSLGKLVALNKWECANQIGSITLHHSEDGQPSLLIAQPGGTFMRIKCHTDAQNRQDFENSEASTTSSSSNCSSMVDYQSLGLARMRNQNISTEILGDFRTSSETVSKRGEAGDSLAENGKGRPYALATLDGTIMLVKNEVILWAMAVDHQIFALTKLDVTGTGSDDIVVCSWDGQTYILDQDRNSVRFHLEQSVQAFNSGYYNLAQGEPAVTCLVYVTFKNAVIIYYDIPLKDLNCRRFEPDLSSLASKLVEEEETIDEVKKKLLNMKRNSKKTLVSYLLYNVKS